MNGMKHVGSKKIKDQLKQYFNASHLALYKPEKDQCDICLDMKKVLSNTMHTKFIIMLKKEEACSWDVVAKKFCMKILIMFFLSLSL